MAYVPYRNYTIVSSAVYDKVSGKWKAAAAISWQTTKKTGSQVHIITNCQQLFSQYEDAETAGVEMGQSWVDFDLMKRPGPFPLVFPARPVLWKQT
jgi:uncharacterized protein (DUF2147 family)